MNEMLTNKVKIMRLLKELTQEELANLVGCTRQTINAIEKNKYSPSLVLSFKIADQLGCIITDIFSYNLK